jgi:hypothetical protein
VLATYASTLLICGVALLVGQAAMVICGRRRWSWLAPAVGLALALGISWATVRLPGEGTASLVALATAVVLSLAVLRGRVEGAREAVREGLPAAVVALAGASLPFAVEGHFGVLGTGFNPDMSQQLFAADWLADSDRPEPGLVENGYPLGPHALAVAAAALTGANLVTAFSGLTIAAPALAALTALTVLRDLPPIQRAVGAALVALPYMAASYLAQGLFKETIQALFVLAFALGLQELARGEPFPPRERSRVAAAVPLGLIAIGSVYAYSAPGLVWLGAAAALFALAALAVAGRAGAELGGTIRRFAVPIGVAVALLVVAAAPEIPRMVEFRDTAVGVARADEPSGTQPAEPDAGASEEGDRSFESERAGTEDSAAVEDEVHFNNRLGNLFNEISPLEALGVWPTGDFRLDPGAGAAPAIAFYACAALGASALLVGLGWWLRRGDVAVPAALAAAVLVYVAAWIAGTPYTAAKAVLMVAPLAMLVSVRGVLAHVAEAGVRRLPRPAVPLLAATFVLGASASSVLALANAPVGPREYSAGLAELRSRVVGGPALVLLPAAQIADEHAEEFVGWELRGVPGLEVAEGGGETRSGEPPNGARYVITGRAGPSPPYRRAVLEKRVDPYRLWRTPERPRGPRRRGG